jgi:hypothetical protein
LLKTFSIWSPFMLQCHHLTSPCLFPPWLLSHHPLCKNKGWSCRHRSWKKKGWGYMRLCKNKGWCYPLWPLLSRRRPLHWLHSQ